MAAAKLPSLLMVDDDDDFRATCVRWMTRKGHSTDEATDGHAALKACSDKHFDVVVLDLNMPGLSGLEVLERLKSDEVDTQVIVLTGQATVDTAVQAMKLGAYDYLRKPFPLAELEERCGMACEFGQLRKENRQLKEIVRRTRSTGPKMIGESAEMKQVYRLIERAGPSDKAILIQGASGTGKELVAKAIQANSPRVDKPFVTINCAALPELLVESELFGHEKGSFTGATETKSGLFEVADGGTLFIDEIGELPLSLQPKLLRVLEDGSMRRVGAHKLRTVDVRIVAATNRDLGEEVEKGNFREDLYYRINVLTIALPPLKDRTGDVERLIDHFLGKDWEIEDAARECLLSYDWPGNIRQLINVLERARILADDGEIVLDDLPAEVIRGSRHAQPAQAEAAAEPKQIVAAPGVQLADLERAHVIRALQDAAGNKAKAARALGIHRRKLYRMIERHNIQQSDVQL